MRKFHLKMFKNVLVDKMCPHRVTGFAYDETFETNLVLLQDQMDVQTFCRHLKSRGNKELVVEFMFNYFIKFRHHQ